MFLYGQEATGQAAPGGGFGMLIMMGLMFVIMYFLIIMPAKKKQKQHQSMVDSLGVGKRVITSGGMYGTVTRVLEDRFEIEIGKDTRVQVTKPSIQGVIDPQDGDAKDAKK